MNHLIIPNDTNKLFFFAYLARRPTKMRRAYEGG